MQASFSHIDVWIFDLDNTLYPASCDLFALIDEKMGLFIQQMFDCDPASARKIQKDYYHAHGTTLSGLMLNHGLEPRAFLDFVHDIDLNSIEPDTGLRTALSRLPGRKLVFTNGSRRHAERVTEKLGIGDLFEDLHDIEASDFKPKPHREAYDTAITKWGIAPGASAMFEDISRNLEVPHKLGMTTVLVRNDKTWEKDRPLPDSDTNTHVHHECDNLAEFLHAIQAPPTL